MRPLRFGQQGDCLDGIRRHERSRDPGRGRGGLRLGRGLLHDPVEAVAGGRRQDRAATSSPTPFIISFVALVVMAWVLAGTIGHLGPGQVTLKNGIISALFIWAGLRRHHRVRQQRLSRPQIHAVGDRQHPLAGRPRYPGRHHRRHGRLMRGFEDEATAHRGLRRHLDGRDDRHLRRQIPRRASRSRPTTSSTRTRSRRRRPSPTAATRPRAASARSTASGSS